MAKCEISMKIKTKWYAWPIIAAGALLIRCGVNEEKVIDFLVRHCFVIGIK